MIDVKQQELLREKYNPDNLFPKQRENVKAEENTNEASLVEYKNTSKIKMIIKKILEFFKIKK